MNTFHDLITVVSLEKFKVQYSASQGIFVNTLEDGCRVTAESVETALKESVSFCKSNGYPLAWKSIVIAKGHVDLTASAIFRSFRSDLAGNYTGLALVRSGDRGLAGAFSDRAMSFMSNTIRMRGFESFEDAADWLRRLAPRRVAKSTYLQDPLLKNEAAAQLWFARINVGVGVLIGLFLLTMGRGDELHASVYIFGTGALHWFAQTKWGYRPWMGLAFLASGLPMIAKLAWEQGGAMSPAFPALLLLGTVGAFTLQGHMRASYVVLASAVVACVDYGSYSGWIAPLAQPDLVGLASSHLGILLAVFGLAVALQKRDLKEREQAHLVAQKENSAFGELLKTVIELADGRLHARSGIDSTNPQLLALHSGVNAMAESLQSSMRARTFMNELLDSLDLGICVLSQSGPALFANRAFTRAVFGPSGVPALIDFKSLPPVLQENIASPDHGSTEIPLGSDGEGERIFRVSATQVSSSTEEAMTLLTLTDRTEIFRLESAFEESRDEQGRSNHARSLVSESRKKLMIIDDEPEILELLATALGKEFEVATAAGPIDAQKNRLFTDADLVLCDLRMPGVKAGSLISQLKKGFPRASIVIMTGHPQAHPDVVAVRLDGAAHVLSKPLPARDQLVSVLMHTLSRKKTAKSGAA